MKNPKRGRADDLVGAVQRGGGKGVTFRPHPRRKGLAGSRGHLDQATVALEVGLPRGLLKGERSPALVVKPLTDRIKRAHKLSWYPVMLDHEQGVWSFNLVWIWSKFATRHSASNSLTTMLSVAVFHCLTSLPLS